MFQIFKTPPTGVDVSRQEGGQRAGTYKGAPVVAQQNARLYGGYTAAFRQKNPPSVAYLNSLARSFKSPLAIRQRLRAPAENAEVFRVDPRGIVGSVNEWEKKDAYFRTLHLRGLGGVKVNPERTPYGPGHPNGAKPYEPRGLTFRFIPSSNGVDLNDPDRPVRRGY